MSENRQYVCSLFILGLNYKTNTTYLKLSSQQNKMFCLNNKTIANEHKTKDKALIGLSNHNLLKLLEIIPAIII